MRMYRDWADVYDAVYSRQGQNEDIPFLVGLVREYGGPVLEAACGTGRLMIPMAEAGFKVHGIDTSTEMLGMFERKLRGLPAGVRKRLSFSVKDMRNFELGRKFRICFIAFNSLYHLQSDGDMMRFFRCVNRHLEDGGVFIIDIFELDPGREQGVFGLQAEVKDPKGRIIRKYSKTVFGKNQVNDEWFKIVTDYKGKRKTLVRKFRLHYLTHDQTWKMLEKAGFRVVKVYSNYGSEPYRPGQNEKMIFVAEKAGKA